MVKLYTLILSIISTALFIVLRPISSIKEIWIPIVFFIVAFIVFFALYFVFLFFVSLTIDLDKDFKKQNNFYNYLYFITLKFLVTTAGVKLITKGLDKVPTNSKFLLVFNHKSRFDPIIQSIVFKKSKLISISKPENFRIPIAGRFMKRVGNLGIDRDNNRKALETIIKAIDLIKNNEYSVGIAPEGQRNFEEGIMPFKAGSFKIAIKAKCPIVVCSMTNTLDIHKNFPFKKTKVVLNVVKVLEYDEYKELNTQEVADYTRKLIANDLNIMEE